MGIRLRYCRSHILPGIEAIRQAVCNAAGRRRLKINPRCVRLVEAMQCYHYPDTPTGGRAEAPYKDGVYDHPVDALRYYFAGRRFKGRVRDRAY